MKPPQPVVVTLPAGNYTWCHCPLQAGSALCTTAEQCPNGVPFALTQRPAQTVWLCGCTATRTPPFCDGSHNKLPENRSGWSKLAR